MKIISTVLFISLNVFISSAVWLRTGETVKHNTIVVSPLSVANNCADDSDCNYRGVCTNTNVCQCDDGYTTFPENHSTGCNYKQKSSLTALLLQLFFWMFGAGYFYLGVIDLALGELFLFWGGLIFIGILGCVFVCFKNRNDPHYDVKVSVITNLFIFLIMIGSFIWGVCSMVAIGNGIQLDGNGATLADL
jgi:hypothetical protein